MKSILVPVEEHILIHTVLESALLLGRTLDGYLEGMAITPNMPPYIASDLAIGDLSFLDPGVRRERAEASRRLFEAFMAAQRVPQFDAESKGLSFGWRRGELEEDDFVGSYGRAFDIIVLGRPSDQANHPRLPTIEAALFESGRPVLLVPPTSPATLGTTVAIAWNRSTETARTVALAMPLLAKAQRIVVIDFEDWGVSGPSTRISATPSHGTACRWKREQSRTRMDMQARLSCRRRHPSAVICSSKELTPRADCGSSYLAGPPATFWRIRQFQS